ncbi:MAG: 30S ribosomal protein S18 [Chloroflexi bacterium]|nr:30S ribosomal protein S18 [Chloroflexota bacterium]
MEDIVAEDTIQTPEPLKENITEQSAPEVETTEAPKVEKVAAPAVRPPRPSPRPAYRPQSNQRRSAANSRRRRRVCSFCVDKIDYIDYKKPELLVPYISGNGKIVSRRRSGTCARHQRRLAIAIKRARFLALLPYTADQIRLHGHGRS